MTDLDIKLTKEDVEGIGKVLESCAITPHAKKLSDVCLKISEAMCHDDAFVLENGVVSFVHGGR